MNKRTASHHAQHVEIENLIGDAQTLLAATADVAEKKVMEARKRLAAAIESGRDTWGEIREKAVAGAKATDGVIRENPYRSLGIALGVGALIGYLLSRNNGR